MSKKIKLWVKWIAFNSILWVSFYFALQGNKGAENVFIAYVCTATFFSLFMGKKDVINEVIKVKKLHARSKFLEKLNLFIDWILLASFFYYDYIFIAILWLIHNLMEHYLVSKIDEVFENENNNT